MLREVKSERIGKLHFLFCKFKVVFNGRAGVVGYCQIRLFTPTVILSSRPLGLNWGLASKQLDRLKEHSEWGVENFPLTMLCDLYFMTC